MGVIGDIAGGFMQVDAINSAAQENMKAQQEAWKRQDAEMRRQQEAQNKLSQEQKSDVIRQAERDLGTLQVIGSGLGASGSSLMRLVTDIAGSEGRDLSRLEGNRLEILDSIQSQRTTGAAETKANIKAIRRDAKSQTNMTWLRTGIAVGNRAERAAQMIAARGASGES